MSNRVADLSVDELRDLLYETMRELVDEVIEEKLGMIADPDEGLELHDDVEQTLIDYLASARRGEDADAVFRELGLE
jgi:hypothetical protein